MDMSFANQALGAEYMVKQAKALKNEVYVVPEDIDREIARLKIVSMGVDIDVLTDEQTEVSRVLGTGYLRERRGSDRDVQHFHDFPEPAVLRRSRSPKAIPTRFATRSRTPCWTGA